MIDIGLHTLLCLNVNAQCEIRWNCELVKRLIQRKYTDLFFSIVSFRYLPKVVKGTSFKI